MSFTLGHMLLNNTNTQLPPILAWTPYQMHAIAPLLNVHHRLPQIPKLVLATTGKVMWWIAPGRALRTMKGATTPYPSQTQIHACHQERPEVTMEETIIQVLMLKQSATQNAKKFQCFQVRFWGGTGQRSSFC
jgi:hypothetical protein